MFYYDMCYFKWSIGMFRGLNPLRLEPIPGVENPVLTAADVTDLPARFIADPFMVQDSGLWWMFFEVMPVRGNRGEIGVAVSEDARRWTYRQIVLREPFHLSYPQVFRWEGNHFMVPETAQAGGVRLYRATRFPWQWELEAVLLEGRLVDPSLFRHGGLWWMFAGVGSDRLCLFFADHVRGPWTAHPANPIIADNGMTARPGGRVLSADGRIIRIAQDAVPFYGTRLRAFSADILTTTEYQETELPESPFLGATREGWNGFGMHHADIHRDGEGQWIACADGSSSARGDSDPPRRNCRRICVIAPDYPPGVTACATHAATVAGGLSDESVEVHVMVIEEGNSIQTGIPPADLNGITVHRVVVDPRESVSTEAASLVLWGLDATLGFDVFHVMSPRLEEYGRAVLGHSAQRPLIVHRDGL